MNGLEYYVGLDVGGTTMKAAVIDSTGQAVGSFVVSPTESFKGQEHGLAVMCQTIRNAAAAAKKSPAEIAAIGVATPGLMDIEAGLILDPPNLKPWRNVPVKKHIADEFGLPTAFQNDANAAAFGEYWVGAGREARSMALFTLGTGIGGGIIIDDHVLEGRHSHGGEVGHMRVVPRNGRLCGCGKHGCLEAYASATAVVNRAKEAIRLHPEDTALASLLGGESELSSRGIFQLAFGGDQIAMQIVDETAFYLALGAANIMHIIDPDVVAFAGGMTAAGEPFLNLIKKHIQDLALAVPAEKTQIRYAQLGSDAGVYGAAACARYLLHRKL